GQSVTPAGQDGSEALLIACCIALGEHILHLCLQLTNFLPLPSNLRYQGGIMGLYGDQPVLRFLVLVRKRLETEETSNLEREHWHQRPAQPCSLWEEEPTHSRCSPWVTSSRPCTVQPSHERSGQGRRSLCSYILRGHPPDGTGKWVSWEQEAACSRSCNTGYDVIVDECCSSGNNRVCLTVPWNIVKPMLTTCTAAVTVVYSAQTACTTVADCTCNAGEVVDCHNDACKCHHGTCDNHCRDFGGCNDTQHAHCNKESVCMLAKAACHDQTLETKTLLRMIR
ncbi:hypothetical protein MAR_019519, partial [Mya arenaria]